MNKTTLTKSLAILLNLTLVGTSFADMGLPGAAGAAVAMPDFVKALTPPEQLGFVTDSFQGQTSKPVVLIQDLHGNYGVQKKIENILKHLQPLVAQGGRPMVLGIEAAWGNIDLTSIRKKDARVRDVASEFLMKEAEITGMGRFAMMSETPVDLVGIDNPEDYILHRDLVRKSLIVRLELAQKVEKLRAAVAENRVDAPYALRHLWRIDDAFHAGKIDLPELSKELGVAPLQNYGEAEAALTQAKQEQAAKVPGVFASNLVRADEDLALLSRLLRQQLTLEEVQFVSRKSQEMLTVIQALIPGENLDQWKEAIRSAIDYYAIALLRDKPLSQHAEELAGKNPDTSVVVVTGGFHTAGISEYFKSKNISYMVIAPAVESHTDYDEMLYVKRLMGVHLSQADMIHKGLAKLAAKQSVQSLGLVGGVEAASSPDIARADLAAGPTFNTAITVAEGVVSGQTTPDAMAAAVAGTPVTPEKQMDDAIGAVIGDAVTPGAPSPVMAGEVDAIPAAVKNRIETAVGLADTTPVESKPTAAPKRNIAVRVVSAIVSAFTSDTPEVAHAKEQEKKVALDLANGDIPGAQTEGQQCSACAWVGPNQDAVDNFVKSQIDPRVAAGVDAAKAQIAQVLDTGYPTELSVEDRVSHASEFASMMRTAAEKTADPATKEVALFAANHALEIARTGPQSSHPVAALPEAVTHASVESAMTIGADVGQVAAGRAARGPNIFARASTAFMNLLPRKDPRTAQIEEERQKKLDAAEKIAA